MKLLIVAVGQRVPDWAQTAWDDYAKRFPPELKVELKAVKTEPRGSKTLATLYAAERQRIEAAIPRGTRIVVLDERGTNLTTQALATRLTSWQLGGGDVALVIGGPDGLEPEFRQAAHERIRPHIKRTPVLTSEALDALTGAQITGQLPSNTTAVYYSQWSSVTNWILPY